MEKKSGKEEWEWCVCVCVFVRVLVGGPEESPLMTRAVDPLALDLLNCHLYNQLLSPE